MTRSRHPTLGTDPPIGSPDLCGRRLLSPGWNRRPAFRSNHIFTRDDPPQEVARPACGSDRSRSIRSHPRWRLNWIDWRPDSAAATAGRVLGALYADPGRNQLSRELAHEAQAWAQGGKRGDLLIQECQTGSSNEGHHRRLGRRSLLAAPSLITIEFVNKSFVATRKQRRRRRVRTLLAIVAALAANRYCDSHISRRSQ